MAAALLDTAPSRMTRQKKNGYIIDGQTIEKRQNNSLSRLEYAFF